MNVYDCDISLLAREMNPGTSKSLPRNVKIGSRATSVPNVYDLLNAVSASSDQNDSGERASEVNSVTGESGDRVERYTSLLLLIHLFYNLI